ncbi:hypothetical protein NF27_HQ00660 [Candidatus Jidaibacter acanthamoeba]|uniref:Ankyrin repeat protein n=1 Tax=Candidatus Jidaibacter acanthamoebae TaxID=86105 RepID=A0A0C1QK64_9RICK|nr:hypothetical protein [Candidatus Jidaibacter acanthamoeba]KIE04528.1 hypothetical protein NF27_HQ00660 [Candidatus Jidaibacter acanthamoeba]
MKRKIVSSSQEENSLEKITYVKKNKTIMLSDIQKQIADIDLPSFLEKGKINLAKLELDIMFIDPKEIDELLKYTNYKPFLWAIEHGNLELMKYFINHTTERGKFLLVCHDNYQVINRFVDLTAEKIEKGSYRRGVTTDILKLFASIKPLQTIEAIEHIFESIGGDAQKVVRILKINLKDAVDKLANENNKDIKEYLEENKGQDNSPSGLDQQSISEKKFTAKLNSSDDKSFYNRVKQKVSFVNQL